MLDYSVTSNTDSLEIVILGSMMLRGISAHSATYVSSDCRLLVACASLSQVINNLLDRKLIDSLVRNDDMGRVQYLGSTGHALQSISLEDP